MKSKKIIIVGAGGHGKVIYDVLKSQENLKVVGFMDSNTQIGTKVIDDCEVILSQEEISKVIDFADSFVVAIGNNVIRTNLFNELKQYINPVSVIHPSVIIGSDVSIEGGTVILTNVVINRGTHIGENSIINSGTIIDHDCIIGKNVHLSIGTLVGSNTKIVDNSFTGIGAIIPSFFIYQ